MGHSRASKAQTHSRLVKAASSRFKERGIDGISLADLMKELDLTHGGFYKHFESRDALVAEALEAALAETGKLMRERLFDAEKPDPAGFIKRYLDDTHREDRADGCAVAALLGDAARKGPDVQRRFREHIEKNVELLAGTLERDPAQARQTALFVLSALYGALSMARAVGDSALAREILRSMRERLPALAGIEVKKRKPAR